MMNNWIKLTMTNNKIVMLDINTISCVEECAGCTKVTMNKNLITPATVDVKETLHEIYETLVEKTKI